MKRYLSALILLLSGYLSATTVTGTISDTNGNRYSNGTVSAFNLITGASMTPSTTDANGFFSITLSPSTYQFTVCAKPVNIGPNGGTSVTQVCAQPPTPIVISGGSQDVSTQINAVAPILGPSVAALLAANNNFTGLNIIPSLNGSIYITNCLGIDDTVLVQSYMTAAVAGQKISISSTCVVSGVTLAGSNVTVTGPGILKKKANVDGVLFKITGNNNTVSLLTVDATNPQPTLNGDQNDSIQVFGGNNNRLLGIYSPGNTASNAIAILGGSGNEVAYGQFTNSYANGVFVACQNSVSCVPITDNNNVHNNTVDGTTTQDCIFFTASPGSLATTNIIDHNIATGNILKNCGDSPIEMGIHSRMSIVALNTITVKGNNGILTRDSTGNLISTNTIEMLSTATGDGIDVLNQLENVDFDYQTQVSNNVIRGKIARACIFSSASNVFITNNNCEDTFITPNAAGSNLEGYCGIVGTSNAPASISDVTFSDNKCRNLNIGLEANFSAALLNYDKLTVDRNQFYGINTVAIDVNKLTLTNSEFIGNSFKKIAGVEFNNTSTVTNSTDAIGPNLSNPAGWSGTGTYGNSQWTVGTIVDENGTNGVRGLGAVPTAGAPGDLLVSRSLTSGLIGFGDPAMSKFLAFGVISGAFSFSGGGVFSVTFASTTANAATSGFLELASTDSQCWRNNANGANICLSKDTSDRLDATQFAGIKGGNFLTSGTIQNSAGTSIMGLTRKAGSGAGNYTSASTTVAAVDGTNLTFTVTIPTGWKLGVSASGGVTTATAVATATVQLYDGTCNVGTALQAIQSIPPAASSFESWSLSDVIAGDNASHTINLCYSTSVGADVVTMLNSSAPLSPRMVFQLEPSN